MFGQRFVFSPEELEALVYNAKQYDHAEIQIQPSKPGTKGAWLNIIFYTEKDQADLAMTFHELI